MIREVHLVSSVLVDREEAKTSSTLLKSLLLLPAVLFGLLLNAYFLLLLWHWFVVPLGVRDITYWQSAGLSAMFSYFLGNESRNEDKKERDYQEWIRVIKAGFKRLLFFFIIAGSFHLFMKH